MFKWIKKMFGIGWKPSHPRPLSPDEIGRLGGYHTGGTVDPAKTPPIMHTGRVLPTGRPNIPMPPIAESSGRKPEPVVHVIVDARDDAHFQSVARSPRVREAIKRAVETGEDRRRRRDERGIAEARRRAQDDEARNEAEARRRRDEEDRRRRDDDTSAITTALLFASLASSSNHDSGSSSYDSGGGSCGGGDF